MGKPFMNMSEPKPDAKKLEEDVPELIISKEHELEIDEKLRNVIGGKIKLAVPEYKTKQTKKVKLSYAQIDDDYYYQLELLQPLDMEPDELLAKIIAAFSLYIPKQIEKFVRLPDPSLNINMYTIIVKKAGQLIGHKEFMEGKVVDSVIKICGSL